MKNAKLIFLLIISIGMVMLVANVYAKTTYLMNFVNESGYISEKIGNDLGGDRFIAGYNLTGKNQLVGILHANAQDIGNNTHGFFYNGTGWVRNDTYIAGFDNLTIFGNNNDDLFYAGNITGEGKHMIGTTNSITGNTTFQYFDIPSQEWKTSEITNLTGPGGGTNIAKVLLRDFPTQGNFTIIEISEGTTDARAWTYDGKNWSRVTGLTKGLDITPNGPAMISEYNLSGNGNFTIVLFDGNHNITVFDWNGTSWNNLTINNSVVVEDRNTRLSLIRGGYTSVGKLMIVYPEPNFKIRNAINITLTVTSNILPIAENVSITPLPLSAGNNAKGHAFPNELEGERIDGNQTRWYANKTLIGEANDSFILLGGNVTLDANITFSIRFNDIFAFGNWFNSSIATVGDTIAPTFKGNRTNVASVTVDTTINLFVNVTDSGVISVVKAEVENPNNVKTNQTMTLDSGSSSDGEWKVTFTTSIVGTHKVRFYARDGSSNAANTGNELTFSVTAVPAPPAPPGGGGGGITPTIVLANVTPMLSFGTVSFSFLVISSPSQPIKFIRFINVGSAAFEKGTVEIIGDVNVLLNAEVCDLSQENCITKDININAGESAFLKLSGNIPSRTVSGIEGVVRFEEQKIGGKTFELPVMVTRPILYNKLALPIANATGLPDAVAIVLSLMIFAGTIGGGLFLASRIIL